MSQAATLDRDLLSAAHKALRAAVLGVSPRDWVLPTPCDQWNVTQVLQHAAGRGTGRIRQGVVHRA